MTPARTRTRPPPRRRAAAGAHGRAPARGRGPRSAATRRRRLGVLAAVLAVGIAAGAYVAIENPFKDAVREITLPLRHEDVIRQQAREKDLDPALIAAVIYQESRFRDQTSHAGAKGLMQILPGTAHFIARKTGGTRFELRDLGTPQINIAYGSWYLRYLLQHYDGEEEPAIAAYNAGLSHVDRWVARAGGAGDFDPEEHIRFPETRDYVSGVLEKREAYRDNYARELGL